MLLMIVDHKYLEVIYRWPDVFIIEPGSGKIWILKLVVSCLIAVPKQRGYLGDAVIALYYLYWFSNDEKLMLVIINLMETVDLWKKINFLVQEAVPWWWW